MVRTLLLSSIFLFLFSSCNDINEDILPIVGIYRAHVIGVAGPFDLIISADRGDDVIIEAPFDGFDYYTITADIDNPTERVADLNISKQSIGSGVHIKGNGFLREGTLQLVYIIDYGNGDKVEYTIVGTKI